ncbi:hypothetical protein GJ698_28645 [Pseudoduganella sp. FT26W]|uniref:Histidine kinase domain-containing protein n=1 Tax=Duganella aquatilis TaxID=2666082 RepID=A0A844DAH6_9BURK|nr:ATP-binding protein [Duganella aquatilis]MRW88051.1 hypothetical protein [Duganella aquatilis]
MRNRKVLITPAELSDLVFRERQAERNRIARILHDDFLQQCQMIVLSLQSSSANLHAIAEKAADAMALGRDLILELRQPNVSASLQTRLDSLARAVCEPAGIQFRCSLSAALAAQRDGFADELFMCLAEAVRNAVRHANASTISITEEWIATRVILSVTDDGRGIPLHVLSQKHVGSHFGLHGMRERAADLGARFGIASDNGAGTTVSFCFGLPAWLARLHPARTARSKMQRYTQRKGSNL